MEIKLCRLVTGETVVGKQVEDEMKNCFLLLAQPEPGGQAIRMGISPYWAPYSREEADIPMAGVMVAVDADPQLAEQYMQITSGIVTATPGDLKNLANGPIPFPNKG